MSKLFKIFIVGIFLFRVDIFLSEEIVNVEKPKVEEKIEEQIVEGIEIQKVEEKKEEKLEIKIETEIDNEKENKELVVVEEKKENTQKKYLLEDYNVLDGTKQNGQATYYAKKFHGNKTTNGEKFSLYEFTGAHRTLPFGTLVKVTNRDNGKSVVVRINDRGPFTKGKIIDLSPVAFEELASLKKGVLNVSIEVLEKVKTQKVSSEIEEDKQ